MGGTSGKYTVEERVLSRELYNLNNKLKTEIEAKKKKYLKLRINQIKRRLGKKYEGKL